MKSKWLWLAALAVVIVGSGAAWWILGSSKPVSAPTTAVVVRSNVEQTVLATGALEASSLVSVGARVSGRIEKLHVALGDTVAAGDLIAEIDSLDQQNAVKAAEAAQANITAQVKQQSATVEKLRDDFDRAEKLQAKGLVSEGDFATTQLSASTAAAQLDALNAQLDQANLNVESAKLDLERARITAPVGGTVVAVVVDEGQTVNAVQTSPTIVKIANLDKMVVKAEISEADVPRVLPGQRVYFTILGEPDTNIDATLLSIEPAPESINTDATSSASSAIYYNGLFEVENPDHKLRISMTAQVTIVLAEARDVLVVPVTALGAKAPDGSYTVQVYDAAAGAAHAQRVSVGLNNNVLAEITDGLKQGDRVVVSGSATSPGTGTSSGGSRSTGLGMIGAGGPPPGG